MGENERRLSPRSWGASTPMKMCIQAVLDNPGALRHMNKNNSERPVCITHPLTPVSTSFLFVFDTEWVMSTCEHQGRDTVLQTGVKIHWSRRSASSCFNRVWRVTKSDVCSPLLCLFPTHFRAKIDFSRKKKKSLLCSHRLTTVIAGPTCLIAHLLAPHDRGFSQHPP